jgi:hypothetical protein
MRDLSLERIRELALEADEVEMTLVALLFAIRSDRSFEETFRTIHPRTVASVRDRRK